uniref:DNA-directed RNA polymerase n=2 Tax=Geranium TaxID=4028 RepID=B7T3M1_9ROSI|nr:RNA polymerase alpha subunit [Geranium palmatum]YP_009250211.1 RNA polymerase alpha subunit [Geranium maderense]ACH47365.1 RNA polymerase alpha subunit [Geranium palmatum]ADJ66361.1 RNA polymerase alpha subunit [Geranium palmatum]AKF43068.1 RNA polymerase alpha subunit [Geranium maderense]AMY96039.1 RNA polymerase alpha subunit [Geranium maderense]
MILEKVRVTTQTPRWKCVESRADGKRLYYGRFILSPLKKGQADIIGIAMRRALLGEIEGTCITHAKFDKIPHEYTTLVGIQESIYEILMNLKEIVLRSHLYGTRDASICVRGPRDVTAQDIILPTSATIVDNTQHIVTITEPIDFCVGLQIERNRGYFIQIPMLTNLHDDRGYPIDSVFMPVKNVNHSIHSYENGIHAMLFLEIWTNGSLTPKEALREASRKLSNLFIPFLHAEEQNFHFENNQNEHTDELPIDFCALKDIYIDQLVELPARFYNCLKISGIHTVMDLLNKNTEDLMKITHFRQQDIEKVMHILNNTISQFLSRRRDLF